MCVVDKGQWMGFTSLFFARILAVCTLVERVLVLGGRSSADGGPESVCEARQCSYRIINHLLKPLAVQGQGMSTWRYYDVHWH